MKGDDAGDRSEEGRDQCGRGHPLDRNPKHRDENRRNDGPSADAVDTSNQTRSGAEHGYPRGSYAPPIALRHPFERGLADEIHSENEEHRSREVLEARRVIEDSYPKDRTDDDCRSRSEEYRPDQRPVDAIHSSVAEDGPGGREDVVQQVGRRNTWGCETEY